MSTRELRIEGVSPRELLAMPADELDALILGRRDVVFSAGSARILASFRVRHPTFVVELGHIDGGGEGVLRMLRLLAHRYAAQRGLDRIDWLVHAVHCPRPNLKLRRVLERRGFRIQRVVDVGEVYRLEEAVGVR